MRMIIAALIAFTGSFNLAAAQQAADDLSVAVGPWRVEAIMKGKKFDNCSMYRVANDVNVTIQRAASGLAMILDSQKWKLDRGKQYPVDLVAGSRRWSTRVSAERDSVTIALTDPTFNEALRTADALEVRGEGSTIAVMLDKSSAALDRLEACYEKNSRSPETNPFVAPGSRP